jgi:aminopeptidase N
MENTTATVMNLKMLYDESLELTHTQQGLVAHELAHQWWGDMVTCAEWSHMWLNEGFATYFQSLYRAHHDGDDAFRYQIDERHRKLAERDDKDPRPVVVDFFNRKDGRNSANVYIKGSSVLHMLRFLIGDELFRETMQRYGERYKYQVAETRDFAQVAKETTGENLDWFFEQWIYLAGHPKLVASKSWSEETKTLKLTIAQTQNIEGLVPIFRLPMDIEISWEGESEVRRVLVDRSSQDFYFTLPAKPLMVIVDKGDWTMKTLRFDKTSRELQYQLTHGDIMARVRAARDLSRQGSDRGVVAALRDVMLGDDFWGVRREAALSLGEIGNEAAVAALLDGRRVSEARVRLAVAEAMGRLESEKEVDDALVTMLRDDPASEVRAAAVTSLARLESARAEKTCLEALKIESGQDVVRNAGLAGLATLRATSSIDRIKKLTGPGNRRTYRHKAIDSYAKLAKKLESERDRERAVDHLADMLDDWYLKTRTSVIAALQEMGEPRAVDPLRKVARSDPVESVRLRAERAAVAIETKGELIAEQEDRQIKIRRLSGKIDELQRDLRALRARGDYDDSDRLTRKGDNEE